MRFIQTISRVTLILLLSLLASCSSKQKTTDITDTMADEITVDDTSMTAIQRVELAQSLPSNEAVSELITASKLYFQEHNYIQALWLADKTLSLIDESIPFSHHEKAQLVIIKASSLQELGYYPESYTQLEQLRQFASDNHIALSSTYYRLLSTALHYKQQPVAALNAQLFAFSLTEPQAQSKQQIEALWKNFQYLAQWQLDLLAKDQAPDSDGWIQLTALANKFGANQSQLRYQLSIWRKKFKLHPGNLIAKELIDQKITIKPINNIAVILPLTGKQYAAGLALQQGILASYANNKDKKIHFIDSNTVNWYGLTNQFATLNIDYVIGPLLKDNVDKYIKHTSVETHYQNASMLEASKGLFTIDTANNLDGSTLDGQTKTTPYLNELGTIIEPTKTSNSALSGYLQPNINHNATPTLLLNTPEKSTLGQQHTVFSMRPESEANQAATTLSRKNYKNPIVLSQKNAVSERIAQAFVKQWYRITGNKIKVIYYDTGAQMQANIKASLEVDKSKTRINKLKYRLNQSIETLPRNRQDIDMIYLVGTPEQTRLVKPYIEVNISPFADVIPVFASSRSHSTQSDYSSNTDLRGLTFTEIPWLLPKEKDQQLGKLSQQLWPKRSDGLSRLFAMGYDSYQLINKIPLMQNAPYIQHRGQTGTLKLDENNILTRSLLWGTYQQNRVASIAME